MEREVAVDDGLEKGGEMLNGVADLVQDLITLTHFGNRGSS